MEPLSHISRWYRLWCMAPILKGWVGVSDKYVHFDFTLGCFFWHGDLKLLTGQPRRQDPYLPWIRSIQSLGKFSLINWIFYNESKRHDVIPTCELLWKCWHFWQLIIWNNENDLTIKSDSGQHLQFLRCFGNLFRSLVWSIIDRTDLLGSSTHSSSINSAPIAGKKYGRPRDVGALRLV